MEDTGDIEKDQEMITVAVTMRYDHYLELEDIAERNETTVEAELQEAIELAVLTSQYMIDTRLDETADWIDVVERSLMYNSGLKDEN